MQFGTTVHLEALQVDVDTTRVGRTNRETYTLAWVSNRTQPVTSGMAPVPAKWHTADKVGDESTGGTQSRRVDCSQQCSLSTLGPHFG